MAVKWLHFFEDLEKTAEYNWGELYVNMDAFSCDLSHGLLAVMGGMSYIFPLCFPFTAFPFLMLHLPLCDL